MADFSTYDTTNSPSGPEKPRVFGLKVLNDIDLLRRHGLGDAPTLLGGYLQAFEDGSGRIYFKVVRADGSTVKEAMAGEYFLRETLDFNGQTAKVFRLEDAAPLPLDAANDGILSRHPSNRRVVKNGPAGGVRHYLSEWSLDGLSMKRMPLCLQNMDTYARAYGALLTTSGATESGVTSTPVELSTFDTNDEALGTVPDHTSDNIEVELDGLYKVESQISVYGDVQKGVVFSLGINGSKSVEIARAVVYNSSLLVQSISATGLLSLSEGDTVSVFVENIDGGSVDLTVTHAQVVVTRLGHVSAENHAPPREHGISVQGLGMETVDHSAYFVSNEPLPFDYTEGHDVLVELIVRLENAETGTDSIDMQVTYEKATLGAEAFDGVTTVATDTGAQLGAGVAAGTLHRVLVPLTFNDANNPLARDDVLRGVIQRNGLTNVGDITLLSAALLVPCYGGVDFQTT